MSVSSFVGLNTSLRGLVAQQRALDITGHNIANAGTAGYSRQEAVLAASPALALPGGATAVATAHLGTGVDVEGYRRVRDGFLDLQYRAQAMRLGDASTRAATLDRTEMALAEPGDNGISALMSNFWNAWGDLSSGPSDYATRQSLVERSTTLAVGFAELDAHLVTVAGQAQQEYDALTGPNGEVASIATEVARLNETVARVVGAGGQPNDLLDRRDLLLDRLATLGQVSVEDLGDGQIRVAFGDAAAPLVDGAAVTWPQALSTPGGRLGALLDLSRAGGVIDTYRTELNGVVRTLADAVNAEHASGGGWPFFSYTAGSEAATLSVAVTAGTVRATATGTAEGNEIALAVADLRGGAPDGAYRTFVSRIGAETREARRVEANAQVLSGAIEDRRQSVSGVSIDEEMMNLVRFQRAFQASARAMSTIDEMLDGLINRTGRVGL